MTKEKKKYGLIYKRKPHSEGGNWSYNDKMKVAATYLACGSIKVTSDLTKCPVPTINRWKTELWWKDMIQDLMISDKLETNKRLKAVTDKALSVVMANLVEGDVKYDTKRGELIRVPVPAKDANKIVSDMLDRQDILEKQIHRMQEKETEKQVDTLKKLAETFASLVEKENKKQQEKVIDVVDVEIVKENTENV